MLVLSYISKCLKITLKSYRTLPLVAMDVVGLLIPIMQLKLCAVTHFFR